MKKLIITLMMMFSMGFCIVDNPSFTQYVSDFDFIVSQYNEALRIYKATVQYIVTESSEKIDFNNIENAIVDSYNLADSAMFSVQGCDALKEIEKTLLFLVITNKKIVNKEITRSEGLKDCVYSWAILEQNLSYFYTYVKNIE